MQQDQQVERRPRAPGPQPPPPAGAAHDPQHQRRQRQAECRTHQQALEQVGDEQPRRAAVEAEALFDAKRAPPFERQIEQRADQHECAQQRELVAHVAPSRLHGIAHEPVERIEATEQRPAQQHRAGEGRGQQTETGLGNRVVGGSLMRIERHSCGKGRRHRIAMRRHVAHLPRGQPKLGGQRRQQSGGEQPGERVQLHRWSVG